MKTVSAALIVTAIVFTALGNVYATSYTYTDLTYDSAPYTVATSINNSGTIVGYIGNPSGQSTPYQGFVLSGGVYTTLSFPGARDTLAYGISNNGAIVGRYQDATGWHGFLLNGGVYTGFDYPGAGRTDAFGINRVSESGTIVGAYGDVGWSDSSPAGWHGYTLSGGVYTALDYPSASTIGTYAADINNSGTVVGEYYDGTGVHGFILDSGVWTTFNYPSGSGWTAGVGISDNGAVVGYSGNLDGGTGFVLSDGVFIPLNHPGAPNTITMDINNSGEVVGYYRNPTGGITSFVATPVSEPCPVPEPSVMLFYALSLIPVAAVQMKLKCRRT